MFPAEKRMDYLFEMSAKWHFVLDVDLVAWLVGHQSVGARVAHAEQSRRRSILVGVTRKHAGF